MVKDGCVSVYDVATFRQKQFFVSLRLPFSFNIYECVYNRSSIDGQFSSPLNTGRKQSDQQVRNIQQFLNQRQV